MPSEASRLVLRPAEPADAAAVAAVQLAARAAAVARGFMPPSVHAEAETSAWLAERLARDEVWVAELDGEVAAYARFTATWLDDLYVHPGHQGAGLGSALLDLVRSLRPDGFGLWVFETNRPAQRFYASHGLVVTERTDGSENEEGAPDLRMEWPGA
jgi:GNAT superfamily N-acetyltransferase